MVEMHTDGSKSTLVIRANRSMSWQTNKKILAAIFFVNTAIALGWTAMGAWMVLPFAGLEVFLVGLGMYYVSWKLSFKEIIIVEAKSLILQKGVHFPKQQWRWQRGETLLIKQPSRYRMSAPTLFLHHLNDKVEIGQAINRTEKKELREHLLKLGFGLRVTTAK